MVSIERLAELDKAATPGPWEARPGLGWGWEVGGTRGTQADAQLIVALRNAAPELLAVVEAAREVEALESGRKSRTYENLRAAHNALREALRALDATGGGE